MAAKEYMCAVLCAQHGGFHVGLRRDSHPNVSNDIPTDILVDAYGGSR
jgi:hypothetical protein